MVKYKKKMQLETKGAMQEIHVANIKYRAK